MKEKDIKDKDTTVAEPTAAAAEQAAVEAAPEPPQGPKKRGGQPGARGPRGSKTATKSGDGHTSRYFIGEIKDRVPVLEREVNIQEAFANNASTRRPFFEIRLWSTKSTFDGEQMVTTKTPFVPEA